MLNLIPSLRTPASWKTVGKDCSVHVALNSSLQLDSYSSVNMKCACANELFVQSYLAHGFIMKRGRHRH